MAKRTNNTNRMEWVEVRPGRHVLVRGEPKTRERGVPRHNRKWMASLSVHPDQSQQFQQAAHQAGLTSIEFDADGRCYASNRRQEHEYAYFRTGYVNLDGGYFETIRESRKRQLRPEDF